MTSYDSAPRYFRIVGTEEAPELATDAFYEYAGTLAATLAAASADVETTKAIIWNGIEEQLSRTHDEATIIGTLATTLAIFTVELFNPAVDLIEEAHPGFDYRAAISRAMSTSKENN
ncbi:hypothetical protein SAMN05660916_03019 [Arthrobacter sp. 31Cvi3.1E]|nr:hypothetical protein SAMN05660916_03019 [Arthrobacter sp. 31Cvi3.1E]